MSFNLRKTKRYQGEIASSSPKNKKARQKIEDDKNNSGISFIDDDDVNNSDHKMKTILFPTDPLSKKSPFDSFADSNLQESISIEDVYDSSQKIQIAIRNVYKQLDRLGNLMGTVIQIMEKQTSRNTDKEEDNCMSSCFPISSMNDLNVLIEKLENNESYEKQIIKYCRKVCDKASKNFLQYIASDDLLNKFSWDGSGSTGEIPMKNDYFFGSVLYKGSGLQMRQYVKTIRDQLSFCQKRSMINYSDDKLNISHNDATEHEVKIIESNVPEKSAHTELSIDEEGNVKFSSFKDVSQHEKSCEYEAIIDGEVVADLKPQIEKKTSDENATPWVVKIFQLVKENHNDIRKIKSLLEVEDSAINFNFPITDDDVFCELEEELENENFAKKLMQKFKRFEPDWSQPPPYNGLSKIISDDVLINYNWDGLHGKLALRNKPKFLNVIYESWSEGANGVQNLEIELKRQIARSHGRVNKRNARSRKVELRANSPYFL